MVFRKQRIAGLLCIIAVLIAFSGLSRAQAVKGEVTKAERYDDLEGAALGLQLALDNHVEEAVSVLSGLGPEEMRRHRGLVARARGLLARSGGNLEEAERYLRQAVEGGEVLQSPAIVIELASVQKELGRRRECAETLERFSEVAFKSETSALLLISCQHDSNQAAKAWKSVTRASKIFSASQSLARERVRLLIGMGLPHMASLEAAKAAKDWASASEALAMVELFVAQGQVREASTLLELARLRFPRDPDLLLSLAQAEFRQGRRISSAHLFERLAVQDTRFHLQAAELFRQEGWRTRAEYQHLFIAEPKDRLKQKMGFALDRGQLSTIAAMTSSLSRAGLLAPGGPHDSFIYASTYARFQSGQGAGLLEALAEIRQPELLEKAVALRKVIESCRNKPFTCTL